MQLITERLLLREFRATDWPAVLAYQSDPRYLRYYAWDTRTPDEVRAFVTRFMAQQEEQPRSKFQLAIELRAEARLIGNCGLRLEAAGARVGEIGYELAPAYWEQGYATEAARAMVTLGFADFQLHRISSYCIADNVASAHVLEKLGMRCEGRLRENVWMKGRWWDTLLYGILDREWTRRTGPGPLDPDQCARDPASATGSPIP